MSVAGCKLLINGTVQGVGFRPTVYKVAQQLGLKGWVRNTSLGVEVVLSTPEPQNFISQLEDSLSRVASLDSIESSSYHLNIEQTEFEIKSSLSGEINDTVMPPDSHVCSDCLQEIFNPNSKYYLYPFTSCVNCGPRYTVIQNLPYDRIATTLDQFKLCSSCHTEYTDPLNRRYHAQTTSCVNCGPQFSHSFDEIIVALKAGKIVALKGTGGYVLLADATNSRAVQTLRNRKHRPDKPFAVMALNTASISSHFAQVSAHECALLEATAVPIVLLPKKYNLSIAHEVAPQINTLGLMLPNNPVFYILFYLLLGQPQGTEWLAEVNSLALIVTSANLSGGTIIGDEDDGMLQLSQLADLVVSHNRKIEMKIDDSVMLVSAGHDIFLRRARGITPKPFYFSYKLPQVLALGAHLKNTICYTRENKAFMSQPFGDMSSEHTIKYFKATLAHYKKIFNFKPELIVTDLHPDFFVRQYAEEFNLPQLQLQHHFAHFASVIASAESCGKKVENLVLGCILDGYGYGLNGEAWGGELIQFNRDNLSFELISQLPTLQTPGGDIAETEPWRIALAMCVQNSLPIPEHLLQHQQSDMVVNLIKCKYFATSSSMGRYFSGIAALLNILSISSYESQAPLMLESMVEHIEIDFDYARLDSAGKPDLDLLIKLIYQVGIVEKNIHRAVNLFYGNLNVIIEKWILFHCSLHGVRQVAISGGCWQSRYLLSRLSEKFKLLGIELLVPYQLPLNDECISFGQAWYGAKTLLKNK